jgi:transposase
VPKWASILPRTRRNSGRKWLNWREAGRRPEALEKEFEPTAHTIYNLAQAGRDAGVRHEGLTTAERQELTKLRRESRQLKMERDILSI